MGLTNGDNNAAGQGEGRTTFLVPYLVEIFISVPIHSLFMWEWGKAGILVGRPVAPFIFLKKINL